MSVYDQSSSNIYPKLPSAPQDIDAQSYRLSKIDKLETFLRNEIKERNKLATRCKRGAAALTITDTSVSTGITVLGISSVIALSTGVGSAASIPLASTGGLLGLGAVVAHKVQKILNSKKTRHEKIKTLAEAKLNTISGLVSKAVEDTKISDQEYQFILLEVKNYRKLKNAIQTKSKKVIKQILTEQREAILAQGREQGKADFLAKIAATSAIPIANVT